MRKKIILLALFFTGLNLASKAQNYFEVKINDPLCLTALSVIYDDYSTEDFSIGCSGSYSFKIESQTIKEVVINGTRCQMGVETHVTVNDGASAKATPRYLIKSDGTVYDCVIKPSETGDSGE